MSAFDDMRFLKISVPSVTEIVGLSVSDDHS